MPLDRTGTAPSMAGFPLGAVAAAAAVGLTVSPAAHKAVVGGGSWRQHPTVGTYRGYTASEVEDHCDYNSCWLTIKGKVYDVTDFLREHPGGPDIIMEYGGRDATSDFIGKGHSVEAVEMLEKYCVGFLIIDKLPKLKVK